MFLKMPHRIRIFLMLEFVIRSPQIRAEDGKRCTAHSEWTVFQRRKYGDVDFYRGWDDYVKGFGNCDGDFWFGLEGLHEMTKDGRMELEINLVTEDTKDHWVAKYSNFRVGPGSDNYTLFVSGYSGNSTRDGFSWHDNAQFSTKDADHDYYPLRNCASEYGGGWWYHGCAYSNLNGNFSETVLWYFDGVMRIMCCSEMKIRRRL